jgi:hypothetical protein
MACQRLEIVSRWTAPAVAREHGADVVGPLRLGNWRNPRCSWLGRFLRGQRGDGTTNNASLSSSLGLTARADMEKSSSVTIPTLTAKETIARIASFRYLPRGRSILNARSLKRQPARVLTNVS